LKAKKGTSAAAEDRDEGTLITRLVAQAVAQELAIRAREEAAEKALVEAADPFSDEVLRRSNTYVIWQVITAEVKLLKGGVAKYTYRPTPVYQLPMYQAIDYDSFLEKLVDLICVTNQDLAAGHWQISMNHLTADLIEVRPVRWTYNVPKTIVTETGWPKTAAGYYNTTLVWWPVKSREQVTEETWQAFQNGQGLFPTPAIDAAATTPASATAIATTHESTPTRAPAKAKAKAKRGHQPTPSEVVAEAEAVAVRTTRGGRVIVKPTK
jgi:hypothetical protein